MIPELEWTILIFVIVFLGSLPSPGFYALLHPWIKNNDPEMIYYKMYGLSYLFNYIPFMAALSQKMRGFYREWTIISLIWGLIFSSWFGLILMIHVGHGGFACVTTIIVWFGIYPLFTWESTTYMHEKYRRIQV